MTNSRRMNTGATKKLRGLERALPIALLRARESTMRKFKPYVDALDLTIQQWRVIRVLGEHETQLASELADKCVILPSSITRILDSLITRQLVQEAPDEDGRRRSVKLTKKGIKLYEKMATKSEAVYGAIEERFSTEKMSLLLELLGELQAAADGVSTDELPEIE